MDSNKNRCIKCNSTRTRVRIKTNDRVCEACGSIIKIEEVEKKFYG